MACTQIDATPLPSCRSWADGRHRLSALCSVRAGLLVSLPPGAPPAHAAHHRRRLLCARSHRFILLARVRARGYSPSIDGTPTKDMVRALHDIRTRHACCAGPARPPPIARSCALPSARASVGIRHTLCSPARSAVTMPRATSRTAAAAPDRTPELRGVTSLALLGTLARPVVIASMRNVLASCMSLVSRGRCVAHEWMHTRTACRGVCGMCMLSCRRCPACALLATAPAPAARC